MNYALIYTKRSVKDIRNLDTVVQKKLAKALLELSKSPMSSSVKLINSAIGSYRLRLGDYRIIFDMHAGKIVILRVGHRREIYR